MRSKTETTLEIRITIESCSTPLTKLYLSSCNDQTDYNNTEVMATFPYRNISSIDKINSNENTSTSETTVFTTDSTVYETMTNINYDSDEDEININHKPSYNFDKIIESSDSDSEEDN
ncbi:unnamed protein product [Rotaria magnacalcarata]